MNEDIVSELKIKSSVQKIQNYRNKRVQPLWQINGVGLSHLWSISQVGNTSKEDPSKDFPTINGNRRVHDTMTPKSLQAM
jgi:hypothetical protein